MKHLQHEVQQEIDVIAKRQKEVKTYLKYFVSQLAYKYNVYVIWIDA